MYLHHAVPHNAGENVASHVVHEGSSSMTNASAHVVTTNQFLCPTTKRILGDIAGGSSCGPAYSASSVTVKRSIFQVKEFEPCTESSTKVVIATDSHDVGAAVATKPIQDTSDVDPLTTTAGENAKDTESIFGIERKARSKEARTKRRNVELQSCYTVSLL